MKEARDRALTQRCTSPVPTNIRNVEMKEARDRALTQLLVRFLRRGIRVEMKEARDSGVEASWEAGEIVFEKSQEKEIVIPVIVFSSMNMKIPGAFGYVWYSKLKDWKKEPEGLVK